MDSVDGLFYIDVSIIYHAYIDYRNIGILYGNDFRTHIHQILDVGFLNYRRCIYYRGKGEISSWHTEQKSQQVGGEERGGGEDKKTLHRGGGPDIRIRSYILLEKNNGRAHYDSNLAV